MSVVFPAPERPMMATSSPGSTVTETRSSATWSPNRRLTPSRITLGEVTRVIAGRSVARRGFADMTFA